MKKIWVVLVIIILLISTLLSGCATDNKNPIVVIVSDAKSGIVPLNVTFDGSFCTDPDGKITNYTWDFGDGNKGYGKIVTHSYLSPGSFIVKLTAKDNNGAVSTNNIIVSAVDAIGSFDEAYKLLVETILSPGSTGRRVNAHMLSQPLQIGDNVSSDENTYTIENVTWFVFIDDYPDSFYAHETRYVLINAGIKRAKGVAASLGDDSKNLMLVLTARDLNEKIKVAVRISNENIVPRFKKAGADLIILPEALGGEKLADAMRGGKVDKDYVILS